MTIGDITLRDGFQHEEKFISTPAKIFYLEELFLPDAVILRSPTWAIRFYAQFRDAEELLAYARSDLFQKRCEKQEVNCGRNPVELNRP
jgi:hydroxymethylglutaryl-CoA lyase